MIELRMVFRPPSSTTSGHFSLRGAELCFTLLEEALKGRSPGFLEGYLQSVRQLLDRFPGPVIAACH